MFYYVNTRKEIMSLTVFEIWTLISIVFFVFFSTVLLLVPIRT